ncbi:hypothetical protein DRH29_04575 [candidate division Kazan bacterium]|uniref:Uncharacterized protein n=1 Tax=candidate division Kazan bacterium TaxID=2202143 RepID=A0A420ZBG9_UNCK3|nr:MAG: hypothetical protein DRH29_04575 [candidate division Kazan bacterium]
MSSREELINASIELITKIIDDANNLVELLDLAHVEILEDENVSLERLKHFYDDLKQIHKRIKVLKP